MSADVGAGTPLFTLEGVERSFALGSTRVRALRGVNLTVRRGEQIAIWGPSGSGKSTLLNILGLVDRADAGRVVFDGQDIASLGHDALTDLRSRKIGFVFQSFNLVPVLSALENVMLPLQVQGLAAGVARGRARDWLDRVGLSASAAARPDQLSGGQRQRVAIARALIAEPMLVIADEPTANLDSVNSQAVIDLMQQMNRATGVTCVFSTHDPRLLDKVPRRVLMSDGLIGEDRYVEEATA